MSTGSLAAERWESGEDEGPADHELADHELADHELADRDALALLLRCRPATTEEAAAILGRSAEETRDCLTRLVAQRYVVWDGSVLGYQSPEHRTITEVVGRMDRIRTGIGAIEALLDELPPLVASWTAGARSAGSPAIEMLRGAVPIAEVWARQLAWEPPERIRLMMPLVESANEFGQERDLADEFIRQTGLDLRCLVGAENLIGKDPEEALRDVAPSATVRVHPRVPTWAMVSGETLVLPSRWGEAHLVDLMLVRDEALAATMTELFDLLWEQGAPVPGRAPDDGTPDWDALLRLLEQGMTVESAGRALGLSPRTAQRRVRTAMGHYGVDSLFSLAIAWSRHRPDETPDK